MEVQFDLESGLSERRSRSILVTTVRLVALALVLCLGVEATAQTNRPCCRRDSFFGVDALKLWLQRHGHALTPSGQDFGLPAPKGILLIGIPGTGKSLTAKMIAALWNCPLVRLDAGGLLGSLVGESEATTRRTLAQVDRMGQIVLWVDEIEKALAQGGRDGGTSTRVVGSILTWMAEKTAPVFVVATANEISALPPELLRKGRFDEIFFLDLPTLAERRAIFEVHLSRHHRSTAQYDLEKLARASSGYVGSEIESAVNEAMHLAFHHNRRTLTTEDILHALRDMIPLSKSHADLIGTLRNWITDGRAKSASTPEPVDQHSSRRLLELQP